MQLKTEQNVREELPDVIVIFNGETLQCQTSGRKNEFCTVRPLLNIFDLDGVSWQFSWAAIRDHINSGNPLKV